jgi:hypothetical protein
MLGGCDDLALLWDFRVPLSDRRLSVGSALFAAVRRRRGNVELASSRWKRRARTFRPAGFT